MSITVLDCSQFQGLITVDPTVDGYILRTSHGHTQDPWFASNVARVRKAGKRLGYYHYWEGTVGEATFFVDIVKKYWRIGDMYPVMDYEGVRVLNYTAAGDFTGEVKRAFGGRGFYSGDALLASSGNAPADMVADTWLWVADYGVSSVPPLKTWGGRSYDLWQKADTFKGRPQDVSIGAAFDTRMVSHPAPPPPHYLDVVIGTKTVARILYGRGRVVSFLGSAAALVWLAKGAIFKRS